MLDNLYLYRIHSIDKVVDGDTLDVTIDLGFNCRLTVRIRMKGYDAPEIYKPINEAEYKAGLRVTKYLESRLYGDLYIRTSKHPGIYGRWEGEVYRRDGDKLVSINEEVLEYMEREGLTKEKVRNEK